MSRPRRIIPLTLSTLLACQGDPIADPSSTGVDSDGEISTTTGTTGNATQDPTSEGPTGGAGDPTTSSTSATVRGETGEDSTGDATNPLFGLDEAVARMRAARRAIDQAGADVLLVGRAEGFLCGRPDLDETLVRLRAYADAGADCLYAPGVRQPEQIRALVDGVAPRPFNLLVGWPSELTKHDIAALGVRRISVGGALARSAWGAFMRLSLIHI